MPDISLCLNITCPKKETCYRFLATPSQWQTYASFQVDEKGECRYYLPVSKKEESKTEKQEA